MTRGSSGVSSNTILLGTAFAGLGATTSLIPALIPMQQAGSLNDELIAAAVPALFGGLLVGVLTSTGLNRRIPIPRVLALGASVQGIALLPAVFGVGEWFFVAGAFVAGVGFGLGEAGGSVLARLTAREHTARLLTVLTALVALTAVAVPSLVALSVPAELVAGAVVLLHAVTAVLGVGVAARAIPDPGAAPAALDRSRLDGRILILVALALALYVGAESILAGWSAVIPATLIVTEATVSASGTSVFWALMAAGRLLAASLIPKMRSPRRYLTVALCCGAVCLALAAIPELPAQAKLLAIGAAVTSIAPAYSILLGLGLVAVDDESARRITGLLVAVGALGGTLLPLAVLAAFTSPAEPAAFAFLAAALAAVVLLLLLIKERRPA